MGYIKLFDFSETLASDDTRVVLNVFLNQFFANVSIYSNTFTAQKMKFFIKDFISKCDQIRRKLRIWSNFPRKSLMENFIFCETLQVLNVF